MLSGNLSVRQIIKPAIKLYFILPWVVKFRNRKGELVYLPRCMYALAMGMTLLGYEIEGRAEC